VEHQEVRDLGHDEISRGRLHKVGANGYLQKSYDLLTSFKDVLGKRVREVPGNYESGELVQDTAIDLETMFPPSSRLRIRCCCRRDLFQRARS
jgi:hypothetical protein